MSTLPPTDSPTLSHIQRLVAANTSPIYRFLLSSVRITHASKGHVVARLRLAPAHMNSKGGLHGSVSATIVDWAGGLAIAAWDRREKTGASVDIHVSYLSSVEEGAEVEIESVAEKVGGSLAFTRVTVYKMEGEGEGERGKVVVRGSHTKSVKQ